MERVIPSVYLLPLVLTMAALPSTAGIITFDALSTGTMTPGASFTEAGFTVTAIDGGHPADILTLVNIGAPHQNVAIDGGTGNGDGFGTVFRITLTGGGLFNLNSLDIGNIGSDPTDEGGRCGISLRIELNNSAGECAAYAPPNGPFTTVSPSGFQNISFLDINIVGTGNGLFTDLYAVDNINLSISGTAAPEPSTILFVGAGLAYAYCGRVQEALCIASS